MSRYRRTVLGLVTAGVVAAGTAASAPAADTTFGEHVAMCAQMSLGQRDDAPVVTCTHDGMTMTFPTFGAMVEHMRADG